MWQLAITLAIVAAAVFFAVRGLVRTLRGRGGCQCGCKGCPRAGGGECHCTRLPEVNLDKVEG